MSFEIMCDSNEIAFPGMNRNGYPEPGLTKREYFAVLAMQGLLAGFYRDISHYNLSDLPNEAVKCADALIASLNAGDRS